MLVVGKTDAFERMYMEKFRAFAGRFGEFVNYEHDRGARDIGIHLTHKLASGKERISSALIWFQMKGIMASTFSKDDYEKCKDISISLKVNHLRYWYMQPMPTYLALYIESVDKFFITNLQRYAAENWGNDILTLKNETATIHISKESELDEQAFHLILKNSDLEEWKKALSSDDDNVKICLRDYDLIWHLGTAEDRNVEHRIMYMDWQSKTRGQLYIGERQIDSEDEWHTLREHWQYMMNIYDLEDSYPYIEFYAFEDEEYENWDEDDEYYSPSITLKNGDSVSGEDFSGEFFQYLMGLRLNEIGQEMFERVQSMSEVGLIEITPGKSETISIAPWHHREV